MENSSGFGGVAGRTGAKPIKTEARPPVRAARPGVAAPSRPHGFPRLGPVAERTLGRPSETRIPARACGPGSAYQSRGNGSVATASDISHRELRRGSVAAHRRGRGRGRAWGAARFLSALGAGPSAGRFWLEWVTNRSGVYSGAGLFPQGVDCLPWAPAPCQRALDCAWRPGDAATAGLAGRWSREGAVSAPHRLPPERWSGARTPAGLRDSQEPGPQQA